MDGDGSGDSNNILLLIVWTTHQTPAVVVTSFIEREREKGGIGFANDCLGRLTPSEKIIVLSPDSCNNSFLSVC